MAGAILKRGGGPAMGHGKSRTRAPSVRLLTLPGRLVAAHRRNPRVAGAILASILRTLRAGVESDMIFGMDRELFLMELTSYLACKSAE